MSLGLSLVALAPVPIRELRKVLHHLLLGSSLRNINGSTELRLGGVLNGHRPGVCDHVIEVTLTHVLLTVEQRQRILQTLFTLSSNRVLKGMLNAMNVISTGVARSSGD